MPVVDIRAVSGSICGDVRKAPVVALRNVILHVTTEDGTEKMTVAEYHSRPEVMELFGRQSRPPAGRQTLFLGPALFSFGTEYLRQNKAKAKAFEEAVRLYESNPLKYFMPQCQTVVDMLNWRVGNAGGTMKVLHAGVGTGKTVAGVIDWLLDIVPTDPSWPIFSVFGVEHREYRGPYKDGGVAVVSYELKNHEFTIWPQVIRRWCPPAALGDYATGKKAITWRANPRLVIAGTPVFFLVSSQKDTAFVSQALDIVHWDEQSTEEKFNNANARVIRRGGRHVMTMTPHCIQGRRDTGAGSYVDRIRRGEMDVGLVTQFFQINRNDVFDWVVTHEDKRRVMLEWIEDPTRRGDRKKLAEGRAIVYGEFHESSGLVIDDFSEKTHVVEPFTVPEWWSFYRYHDHGRKEPCACLLVAVDDRNNWWVIGEHYEAGLEISENAKLIIERLSGNTVEQDEFGCVHEVMTGRFIRDTVGDPRSLGKSLDNSDRTIQAEYRKYGLEIRKGSGQPVEVLAMLLGEVMRPDPNRIHPVTGKPGAPRVFIFRSCEKTIWELKNWRMRPSRSVIDGRIVTKEKPAGENDHAIECLLLMAADEPQYVSDTRRRRGQGDDDDEHDGMTSEVVSEITGCI